MNTDLKKESKYHAMLNGRTLTTLEKGAIAEAAVLSRLTILGYQVFKNVFDGNKTDFLVLHESFAKPLKLEVKWASVGKYGLPLFRTTCSDGRKGFRQYGQDELDVLVGYDLYSDTAHVLTWSEIGERNHVTISHDTLERWDKLTTLSH